MKILIASPTYDGNVRKEYMQSIMALTDYFRQAAIAWEMVMEPATLLHVMRSVMATKALTDKDITHILFVDTDMGFQVSAVKKLIEASKEIIGCAYPYRTIPLHEKIAKPDLTFRQAIAQSVPYAVHFPRGAKTLNIVDGVVEVSGLGTGLMLISKATLQTMVERKCVEAFANGFPYNQWYRQAQYYGFFDYVKVDGAYIGEDYSFCHRWIHGCEGKIYAVVNEEIMHVGPTPIVGRYSDRLRSGKI